MLQSMPCSQANVPGVFLLVQAHPGFWGHGNSPFSLLARSLPLSVDCENGGKAAVIWFLFSGDGFADLASVFSFLPPSYLGPQVGTGKKVVCLAIQGICKRGLLWQ